MGACQMVMKNSQVKDESVKNNNRFAGCKKKKKKVNNVTGVY